jgi:lysophospholipase-2
MIFCRSPALLFLMLSRTASAAMSTTSSSKRGALIFLHGLGDTPAGWSELEYSLPEMKPRLKNIEYVFPHAPTIPLSINGGARMPGWFDLYDWPIGVGSKDDKRGLMNGVQQIEQEVAKLKILGIPASKIVVAGFSQGGAVALLSAYRNTGEPFAGCAGLSAWLVLPGELQVPETAQKTPLYWGHGRLDDKVLFPQQKFGVDKLREAGVTVTDEQFNMGHMSHPDEMQALADFVDQMIFGDDSKEDL